MKGVISARACRAALLCTLAGIGLGACGAPANHSTGVYMLLDTSGTTDSFAVARIDTGSFSEKDIVARVTFEDRPSAANAQKRQFSETVAAFLTSVDSSPHTDISGGLLQAVEFLNEKNPGRKTIFIFSDLEEDLEDGYIRDFEIPLDGVEVVALNVTKLRSDNIDPREYLQRLEQWRDRVEREGGSWRVVNDLDHLENLLSG